MPERNLKVESTSDPRIADLIRLGGGEGFATYSATFEGKPAVITDSGTLADFLNEEDLASFGPFVSVDVFDTEEERATHLEELGRRHPRSVGRSSR